MDYRVGETRVAVMFGFDEHAVAPVFKPQEAGVGFRSPQEPSTYDGLILTIDARGIVRGRAAEKCTPRRIRMVRVSTAVYDKIVSVDRQPDRQGISVAVGGVAGVTKPAEIHHQLS